MHFITSLLPFFAAVTVFAAPVSNTPRSRAIAARDNNTTTITHIVDVGKNNLTYTPPYITANPGDIVHFNFYAKNHTLVQSTFQDPCEPLVNGIFAGFQPTNITKDTTGLVTFKTVEFEVGTTAPLWFYCAQANHCQSGMTFAINPPAGSVQTFNKVAAGKAKNIAPSGGPVGVLAGLEQRLLNL
jgi:plastocyanin